MLFLSKSKHRAYELSKLTVNDSFMSRFNKNDFYYKMSDNREIKNAVDNGYIRSISIIRYLLDECNNASSEENRIECTEKVFNHLIENPTILIYEPEFRTIVSKKMDNLETYLDYRVQTFLNAKYDEAIQMMRTSMRVNIHSSKFRDEVNQHLDSIYNLMDKYRSWSVGANLRETMNKLRQIMEEIKRDHEYVPYTQ